MSVQISQLTKIYGSQKALDNVSFNASRGEILGFLGPNGAGKSTTMKIATGFIPPSEGEVTIEGFNVQDDPLKVKKTVGYLPEHNPLYLDMYVREYLGFIGELHSMSSKVLRSRVDQMIELCGLPVEQNKKIGSLSKGYRQRVGLAQALLHDPEVLILDEPTTGLDPNQIIEIRELIKSISTNKTVIFSTHILQEVQAICDRVVIINRGKIVADDHVENLLKKSSSAVISVEFSGPVKSEDLLQLEGVTNIHEEGNNRFKVTSDAAHDVRGALFNFATKSGVTLLGLNQVEDSMEDIFRKLTNNTEEE